jgi:hypothetical protein
MTKKRLANRGAHNPFKGHQTKRKAKTVELVQEAIERIGKKDGKDKSFGGWVTLVADTAGIARTTLRADRNAEAYRIVATAFATRAKSINDIPDDIADARALRQKLFLERTKVSNLKRDIEALTRKVKDAATVSAGGVTSESVALSETYFLVASLIERFEGTVKIDRKRNRIVDTAPVGRRTPIIADGSRAKYYIDWYEQNPAIKKLALGE